MTALNIAVWGIGPHAVRHILPAIEQCPSVALVGVCSRNAAAVATARERYHCEGWTDPAEMLGSSRVDVVYLSTPTGLHARQGLEVLSSGKHLWCEKPIARTAGEVAPLLALSRAGGLSVAEAFMYLHHPHFAQVKAAMESGGLGRVHSITCRFGIGPLDRPSFRTDPDLGGSALLDVGSYPLSAMTAFFAENEPEICFSEIETAPGYRVDVGGRALLRYSGQVTAAVEWRIDCAYRNEIDLWGTEGSVISERIFSKTPDYVPRLRFLDRNGQAREEQGEATNHFVAMLTAFRGLADDTAAAEKERQVIDRRMRLIDAIRNHSRG
jgi:predicted dehydrogenase